ncbi:unnamed protein product [Rangifer tarandus platyrhynchus]|uniref:Uncharacterized protein n=2 Tax=Rangifer tarandus platyrhynchus TaxID=3082113 RepID=A0ABN8Z828_RANTA|nr:unnamed protein product [Rangifer tarandus platyrhynchus]CAI9704060.1 unnamed protein product [Rangifer tarandus platyrhynchus]
MWSSPAPPTPCFPAVPAVTASAQGSPPCQGSPVPTLPSRTARCIRDAPHPHPASQSPLGHLRPHLGLKLPGPSTDRQPFGIVSFMNDGKNFHLTTSLSLENGTWPMTQAEGDALRPRGRRTALQEDPLPGRAGSLRDGTLAGLRGAAPRRWPSAGLGGAWTAAVRGPGGRLPSASEDGPRSRRRAETALLRQERNRITPDGRAHHGREGPEETGGAPDRRGHHGREGTEREQHRLQ